MPVIVIQILEVCLIPLLGALTTFLISFVNAKTTEVISHTDNEKEVLYLTRLNEIIVDCVKTTNQTYVNTLKEQGKFDKDAQKTAFLKTVDAVWSTLSESAEEYLNMAVGDLTLYIHQKVESAVADNKTSYPVKSLNSGNITIEN